MPILRRAAMLVLPLALPLGLGACGGGEKKEKDQRTAAGEILPGSISDSMLPYDTVRSQPPLAPKAVASGKARDAAAAADEGPGDPPVDAAEAPAPAEAPAAPAAPTE